jgi:hypothetical protein
VNILYNRKVLRLAEARIAQDQRVFAHEARGKQLWSQYIQTIDMWETVEEGQFVVEHFGEFA